VALAAGRSPFRVEDLLALAALFDRLTRGGARQPAVSEILPHM
jgi:hypothetical protein